MEGEEVDITAANDHGWLQVFLEGTWQLIAVSLNFLGNLGFFFFFYESRASAYSLPQLIYSVQLNILAQILPQKTFITYIMSMPKLQQVS